MAQDDRGPTRRGVLLALLGGTIALTGAIMLASRQADPERVAQRVVDAGRRRRRGDPAPYLARIRRENQRHPELGGQLPLQLGVLDTETHFNPSATSRTGAAGIAQFTGKGRQEVQRLARIPEIAKRYSDEPALLRRLQTMTKEDSYDPDVGIAANALYLASLLARWRNAEAAVTAYNAGGKLADLVARAGSHAAALPYIRAVPEDERSQAETYAPEVLAAARDFANAGFAGAASALELAARPWQPRALPAGWEELDVFEFGLAA